jgi:glutathione S-transferase
MYSAPNANTPYRDRTANRIQDTGLVFWGVIASPYQLKMQALADFGGVPWQRWPDQAGLLNALKTPVRLARSRRRQTIARFPKRIPGLDEYPAVPYYSLDGDTFYYDSTALALHLDHLQACPQPLLPEQPALRFICRLIDEAYDEFGLYMVHHNRWVTSAATNVMGDTTSKEMRKLLPPGSRRRFGRRLAERQVRRCCYLFSAAPVGFSAGVDTELTVQARPGFPATHELLDEAWRRYLAAMEQVLCEQPFLLGERFTLADASAYGQLSMNLIDGRAAELLEQLAPRTFAWLSMIRDGKHANSTGNLYLSPHLQALLDIIGATFIPLMQQNEAAYCNALKHGQTLFNEAAFDRGEALYDGTLLGRPFRAVVKTFQVTVWRELCLHWDALADSDREQLKSVLPVPACLAGS